MPVPSPGQNAKWINVLEAYKSVLLSQKLILISKQLQNKTSIFRIIVVVVVVVTIAGYKYNILINYLTVTSFYWRIMHRNIIFEKELKCHLHLKRLAEIASVTVQDRVYKFHFRSEDQEYENGLLRHKVLHYLNMYMKTEQACLF